MTNNNSDQIALPKGVMLNSYPDSIGENLSDTISVLKKPEFQDVFSLFYVLPTFFNSDLDRGFCIIDYDLNEELVTPKDVQDLKDINIKLKFDFVLNHLSANSPQFQDLLQKGDESEYKDFFIDWNEFWGDEGYKTPDGYIRPKEEYLKKLFMRKVGFPIMSVRFPDGTDRFYWNTFYQEVRYNRIRPEDLEDIEHIKPDEAVDVARAINFARKTNNPFAEVGLDMIVSCTGDELAACKQQIRDVVAKNCSYRGQMDLNAHSEAVWDFYEDTMKKLKDYGADIIRLDAFAYLHKEPGEANFFNSPGTWDYLDRVKQMAKKYDVSLLPEIHVPYGKGQHEEVADHGFLIYDFFFPGLVIDAIERSQKANLLRWINEIVEKDFKTVNMLGCHDGIPILDISGGFTKDGEKRSGLLSDDEIETMMNTIIDRGGLVKDLYGADGKRMSYYQVCATFFSALGEDEQRMRLARAIQLFMPGVPQIWYLDLFAGKNDYAAADLDGNCGYREINRTNLSLADVEEGLKNQLVRDQLDMIRLRNTFPAFEGALTVADTPLHVLEMTWTHGEYTATLHANLENCGISIVTTKNGQEDQRLTYGLEPAPTGAVA